MADQPNNPVDFEARLLASMSAAGEGMDALASHAEDLARAVEGALEKTQAALPPSPPGAHANAAAGERAAGPDAPDWAAMGHAARPFAEFGQPPVPDEKADANWPFPPDEKEPWERDQHPPATEMTPAPVSPEKATPDRKHIPESKIEDVFGVEMAPPVPVQQQTPAPVPPHPPGQDTPRQWPAGMAPVPELADDLPTLPLSPSQAHKDARPSGEKREGSREGVGSGIADLFSGLADALTNTEDVLSKAGRGMADMFDQVGKLGKETFAHVADFGSAFTENLVRTAGGLASAVGGALGTAGNAAAGLLPKSVRSGMAKAARGAGKVGVGLARGAVRAAAGVGRMLGIGRNGKPTGRAVNPSAPQKVSRQAVAVQSQATPFKDALYGRRDLDTGERTGGIVGIGKALGGAASGLAGLPMELIGVFSQATSRVKGFVEALSPSSALRFDQALYDMTAVIGVALQPALEAATGMIKEFGASMLPVMENLRPIVASLAESLSKVAKTFGGALAGILNALMPVFKLGADLFEALTPVIRATTAAFSGLVSVVVEATRELAEFAGMGDAVNGFKDAMETVAKYMLLGVHGVLKLLDDASARRFTESVSRALLPKNDRGITGMGAPRNAGVGGIEDWGRQVTRSAMMAGPGGAKADRKEDLMKEIIKLLEQQDRTSETVITKLQKAITDKLDEIARKLVGGDAWDATKQVTSWIQENALDPAGGLAGDLLTRMLGFKPAGGPQ